MIDPKNNHYFAASSSDKGKADKDNDLDSACETEGSHSLHKPEDEEDPIPISVVNDNKLFVPTTASRKPYLWWCLGLVVVIVGAVVIPVVLLMENHGSHCSLPQDVSDTSSASFTSSSSSSSSTSSSSFAPARYDSFEYTPKDNDQCPGHSDNETDFMEVYSIFFAGDVFGEMSAEARTFDVDPSHTVLSNSVIFNVETVEAATDKDLNKAILTEEEMLKEAQFEAGQFYRNQTLVATVFPPPPLPNVTFEAMSNDAGESLVFAGSQGFLAACMMSFAQHLPLALSPDHLWTIIAQGFARHVDQHADELRHLFVAHDGKKDIKIQEDSMRRGMSPPEQWEELIFPEFAKSISENMNNQEAYETLAGKFFSTTTATAQAASEIVLMAAMKSYFEYTMSTACGIPKIRLEGRREDWVALRDRTGKLAQWMMPGLAHGELWINDIVLPILDQFVDAYDGNINYCFWQTMVKFRNTGDGSGSFDFLSGWLPTLFPYLSLPGNGIKPNPFLRRWEESASSLQMGPEPNEIPAQLASVPVKWEYFQEEYLLHFHAGFRGVTQESDGTVKPVLGWYVSNDPEQE